MEGAATTGMESILTTVTSVVTESVSWLGEYAKVLTAQGNEIMLLFVCIPLVGLGIGLLRRMISL